MNLVKSEVNLIPLGNIDPDLLRWLSLELSHKAQVNVKIASVTQIPHGAFDKRREQYLGDALLAYLRELQHALRGTLLGIIDADCYTDGLNFIFGQASLKGHEAFIALPRLRQTFYGLPQNVALFRERALKEAMHELGHTWGLPHCPDTHCVMHFSNSLHDTDVKETQYCCGDLTPGKKITLG